MSLESRLWAELKPWLSAPAWVIALSGGLDSSVLLHLLARLRASYSLPPLSAIHIHHGLQTAADEWVVHCRVVCEGLAIPLTVQRVTVETGASMERAAREARYQAWEQHLPANAVLLLAQHQDDQAETLLLRLLRGAGVRGLAAMPKTRHLGKGHLFRPLLAVSRTTLAQWASQEQIAWCEDPSNHDTHIARNFLRHRVMPILRTHWPAVTSVLARNAEQCSEAETLLTELAELDLRTAKQGEFPFWLQAVPSLALAPLRDLSAARQRNLLRHWLQSFTLLPDRNHWQGWECLRDADDDAIPRWALDSGELRREGERIWWLSETWLFKPETPVFLSNSYEMQALPGNGRVWLEGALPTMPVCIRYRQGGEQLLLHGRGRRDLKRILQEQEIPRFVRERLPLLYSMDGELLALANLDLPLQTSINAPRLCWQPPVSGAGLS